MDSSQNLIDGDTSVMVDLYHDQAVMATTCIATPTLFGPDGEEREFHSADCAHHGEGPPKLFTITLAAGHACHAPEDMPLSDIGAEDIHWTDSITLNMREESAAQLCAMLTVIFHQENPTLLSETIAEAMQKVHVKHVDAIMRPDGSIDITPEIEVPDHPPEP